MTANGLLKLPRWIKSFAGKERQRAFHLPDIQDAVKGLRAHGIRVTPCGDAFQHWQLGDFQMTDADVVHFAVSRGIIADS